MFSQLLIVYVFVFFWGCLDRLERLRFSDLLVFKADLLLLKRLVTSPFFLKKTIVTP